MKTNIEQNANNKKVFIQINKTQELENMRIEIIDLIHTYQFKLDKNFSFSKNSFSHFNLPLVVVLKREASRNTITTLPLSKCNDKTITFSEYYNKYIKDFYELDSNFSKIKLDNTMKVGE